MYRAYVDGAWLPWVSNADPEWMEAAQIKYALGGRLDTASYYAGIGGKNIEGLEILLTYGCRIPMVAHIMTGTL